jgi:hypothetical protein
VSIVRTVIYIVRYTIHFPNYNPIIVYSSKVVVVCLLGLRRIDEPREENSSGVYFKSEKIISMAFSVLPRREWKIEIAKREKGKINDIDNNYRFVLSVCNE